MAPDGAIGAASVFSINKNKQQTYFLCESTFEHFGSIGAAYVFQQTSKEYFLDALSVRTSFQVVSRWIIADFPAMYR